MIEFIKWCFEDTTKAIFTLIVLAGIGTFILKLVKILMGEKGVDENV